MIYKDYGEEFPVCTENGAIRNRDGTETKYTLTYGSHEDGEWAYIEFEDGDGKQTRQNLDGIADAASFLRAWQESEDFTLEERLGPFGIEWEREQEERGEGR